MGPITALKTGTTTITIDSDRSGIQKGITDLIDQYNKVQTFIGTYTGFSTSVDGKVKAGVLFGESEVQAIPPIKIFSDRTSHQSRSGSQRSERCGGHHQRLQRQHQLE